MKKIKDKRGSGSFRPRAKETSVVLKDRGLVFVLDPKHMARDRLVWTLHQKGYSDVLLAYLLDVTSATIRRIRWSYYERVREVEEATCDLCGIYNPEDVGWKEGLYNLCSECYQEVKKIKEITGTSRYKCIKYEAWKVLKDQGFSEEEIEKMIFENGWDTHTSITKIRKLANKRWQKLVNE